MGCYLGSLLEFICGEFDSVGIDVDVWVLFVGFGVLLILVLVLVWEVGVYLCCLDIDEEVLGYVCEIVCCQGLEVCMQFFLLLLVELVFFCDVMYFLIVLLVQQKSVVLVQICQVMCVDVKVLLCYGSGIKGLFNYLVELVELEGWWVCVEWVSQLLYDILILEKVG